MAVQHLPMKIRRVWAANVHYEFTLINQLSIAFPYIALDTEFPGVVCTSKLQPHIMSPQHHYHVLKANVDALKLIQLGLTLSDADGNLPTDGECSFIWEFNFKDFNLFDHGALYAPESIELLNKNGIDFVRNREEGIELARFGKMMRSSALLGDRGIHWLTFHGGYDFGYLIKIVSGVDYLPYTLEGFWTLVGFYFGDLVFDIKHMIRYCAFDGGRRRLYGGLEKVANMLGLERLVGMKHQAGSDSLLSSNVFFTVSKIFFHNNGNRRGYAGVIYGLEFP